MASFRDHPLLLALEQCLERSAEKLEELCTLRNVCSVASHVLAVDGEALYLHKQGTGRHQNEFDEAGAHG